MYPIYISMSATLDFINDGFSRCVPSGLVWVRRDPHKRILTVVCSLEQIVWGMSEYFESVIILLFIPLTVNPTCTAYQNKILTECTLRALWRDFLKCSNDETIFSQYFSFVCTCMDICTCLYRAGYV